MEMGGETFKNLQSGPTYNSVPKIICINTCVLVLLEVLTVEPN